MGHVALHVENTVIWVQKWKKLPVVEIKGKTWHVAYSSLQTGTKLRM